ncbi:MAG: hypothetical protein HC923_09350, partial [Myxococcales bacterium]|nr:hypothetical protein [Myxococcales bacterium]
AARPGFGAALVFVAQRGDVSSIEVASEVDPTFAEALRAAAAGGVRIIGRRCQVTLREMVLGVPVPVDLG